MDNMISGLLAAAVFIAFVGGLAESIGAAPFVTIVTGVIIMLLIDLVQSIKKDLKAKKPTKAELREIGAITDAVWLLPKKA